MVRQIFLLKELVRRDFQSRYAGSILGFFWPFLLPLWQLVLFTFVVGLLVYLIVAQTAGNGLVSV